jgi:CBS domain-containing protein
MQVQQLMTKRVYTCGPDEPLRAAARIMWDHDCGCVPVVDSAERLIGIVTDRDIAITAHMRGLPLEEIRIGDVMKPNVVGCRQTESVARAMDKMRKFQVHRLPVIDEFGRLTGLITSVQSTVSSCRTRKSGKRWPESVRIVSP